MNRKSRTSFALISFFLFIITVTCIQAPRALAADYTDVTVTAAGEMIEQKPSLVILDVRNQSEYEAGHIRNAKLIPVWQLSTGLGELNKNDEILVYCKEGARSAAASLTLTDNGFRHVYNMLEGITAWIAAGYQVYVKYASLQEAIDNATAGGNVNISSGTYYEHVIINKPLTLSGENKSTTVVDGSNNGTVINVEADNITISDLTAQNSGCSCSDYAGIYVRLPDHQNITVTNNLIRTNGYGIKVISAQNIIISHNEITGDFCGIEMAVVSNATIIDNVVAGGSFGIDLNPSFNTTISGNSIRNITIHGLVLRGPSNGNTILNNQILRSGFGVGLYSTFNNVINENRIEDNGIGIDLANTTNDEFYQNSFLNNGQHVQFYEPSLFNAWNSDIVKGGNYWSSYTGVDANNDGIGDSPFTLDMNNTDNYPLMGMSTSFPASTSINVDVVSNSTIEDFTYFNSTGKIQLHVSNATQNQSEGFFRMTIPHELMLPPYSITINSNPTSYTTIYENSTLSIIYFTHKHSTLEIDVVPEAQSVSLLVILITIPLLTLVLKRKKRSIDRGRVL